MDTVNIMVTWFIFANVGQAGKGYFLTMNLIMINSNRQLWRFELVSYK